MLLLLLLRLRLRLERDKDDCCSALQRSPSTLKRYTLPDDDGGDIYLQSSFSLCQQQPTTASSPQRIARSYILLISALLQRLYAQFNPQSPWLLLPNWLSFYCCSYSQPPCSDLLRLIVCSSDGTLASKPDGFVSFFQLHPTNYSYV